MSTIFRLPKVVAIDSSGTPYPSAKLAFFLTGTDTPADVYTDADRLVPHDVPVQADAAGVFPTIYLDPDQELKVTLSQSDDTLIYTVDPVAQPLPLLDQKNVFTAAGSGGANNFAINFASTLPGFQFNETDGTTDDKLWDFFASSDTLTFRTGDGATETWLTVNRVAGAVTNITLAATALTLNGAVSTPNLSASEVGYKGTPINQPGVASYTLVLADAGKYIQATENASTFTIPANASVAFPIGTTIAFEAAHSSGLSIAITSDTLYLAGTGFATTGTRTLAQGGIATAVKRTSTTWIISGTGIT